MKRLIAKIAVLAVCGAVFLGGAFTGANVSSAGPAPERSLSGGKKYLEMSDDERLRYLTTRASEIVRLLGLGRIEAEVPPEAILQIKLAVDKYASQLNARKKTSCGFGDNLQATYERASRNAPFIIESFNQEKVEPKVGLYLAMVESAHCPCLQNTTGALGLFQLTRTDARRSRINAFADASTLNPDDRCGPGPASLAAARRLKALANRYGSSELRLSMAVAAFDDPDAFTNLPGRFWDLIANGDRYLRRREQSLVLPSLLGAAIIGENPHDFGLDLAPISNYRN